jgi:hypothetical protein
MNRTVFALLILLLTAAFAFPADEPPFMPLIPQIMGEGGASVASAHGFESFFTNPAGFSRAGGDFSISTDTWIYARPDKLLTLAEGFANSSANESDLLNLVNSEVTSGGFGLGELVSIGYAGSGLGLGGFIMADSYLWGPSLLGVGGDISVTIAFVGGLSVPIQLGDLKLHLGADLRPMVRVRAPLSSVVAGSLINGLIGQGDILSALNSVTALHGVGIGIDVGAIAEIGWFSFGVSARDVVGTTFMYNQSPVGTILDTLTGGQTLPQGTPTAEPYTIPMDVSAGVSFHPDLGSLKTFIDPTVHVDMKDIIGVILNQSSPWTLLHIGAEVKLLSLLTVQAGIDQGYLTAGVGLHLLFLDLNFAMFTREMGTYLMDRPSSGATLEVAIRF